MPPKRPSLLSSRSRKRHGATISESDPLPLPSRPQSREPPIANRAGRACA